MPRVTPKCIVNIHTPIYVQKYHRLLHSQETYAARYGYHYHSISVSQEDAGPAKWFKIECLLEHLNRYSAVLLLDADCLVWRYAPDICQEIIDHKFIYMARGFSGRFNSGVIFVLSSADSTNFFQEVLNSRGKTVRPENFVSEEGENGHIIELSQSPRCNSVIQELSYKWNNNRYPYRPDYIRHFSQGPMREHFESTNRVRDLKISFGRLIGDDLLEKVVSWKQTVVNKIIR